MPKANVVETEEVTPLVAPATDVKPEIAQAPSTVPTYTPHTASGPNLQKWFWVIVAGVALIAGLVGFIIGEHVGQGRASSRFGTNVSSRFGGSGTMSTNGQYRNGMMGGMMRGGRGTVTAVSTTSITINELRNNSSVTYTVDSSTVVTKSDRSTGTISDVKVGDEVMVRTNTSNSNSSSSTQTATSIYDMGTASATSSNSTSTPTTDPSTT